MVRLLEPCVDEESVGQWTGAADCKGNPIYEGDIVEDGEGIAYEVCWNDRGAMYYLLRMEKTEFTIANLIDAENTVEVIGNVYEERTNEKFNSNTK